jgi:hypothetical protein
VAHHGVPVLRLDLVSFPAKLAIQIEQGAEAGFGFSQAASGMAHYTACVLHLERGQAVQKHIFKGMPSSALLSRSASR